MAEVSTVTSTGFATSVTGMSVNLPACSSGDLLLAFVETRNPGSWTVPTGWVEFGSQLGGSSVGELTAFYKIADGTEGSTATWTASTGTTAVWQVRKVTNWHGTTPPEVATARGDYSTNPNPPSLTPSWGSAETAWIEVAGNTAISALVTGASTNYTGYDLDTASSGGARTNLASAYRLYTGASEDPGEFPNTGNIRYWAVMTVAIRPSAGGGAPTEVVITKGLDYEVKTDTSATKGLNYSVETTATLQKALAYEVRSVGTIQKSLVYMVESEQSPITKAMAYTIADSTRYWVGGSGAWTDTSHWSTSSGGSGGASVPTSSSNVIIDGGSSAGAFEITSSAIRACKDISIDTSHALTLNMTSYFNVYGDITIGASTVIYDGGSGKDIEFDLVGTTGARTVTMPNDWGTTNVYLYAATADDINIATNITGSTVRAELGTTGTLTFNGTSYQFYSLELGRWAQIASATNLGSATYTIRVDDNSPSDGLFDARYAGTLSSSSATVNIVIPNALTTYTPILTYFNGSTWSAINVTIQNHAVNGAYVGFRQNVTTTSLTFTDEIQISGFGGVITLDNWSATNHASYANDIYDIGFNKTTAGDVTVSNTTITWSDVSSSTASWYADATCTNGGNNTGWIFITDVLNQKALAYEVESQQAPITKSMAYGVILQPLVQKALSYGVESTQSPITRGMVYGVKSGSDVQRDLAYSVLTQNTVQIEAIYAVITESTPITKGLVYGVASTPSATNKTLEYRVLSVTNTSVGLSYGVTTSPAITKGLAYIVVNQTLVQKGMTYEVRSAGEPITKTLAYQVQSNVGVQKGMEYRFVTTPLVQRTLEYSVSVTGIINKDLLYRVLSTGAPIQKGLSYRIYNRYGGAEKRWDTVGRKASAWGGTARKSGLWTALSRVSGSWSSVARKAGAWTGVGNKSGNWSIVARKDEGVITNLEHFTLLLTPDGEILQTPQGEDLVYLTPN